MSFWSFYFLTKLYMFYKGFIRWDILLNFLFAAFIITPVPRKFRYYRAAVVLKNIAGVCAGLALLWHDSWFPPPLEALTFLKQQGMPSKEYIYSFLLGYYNPKILFIMALTLGLCFLLNKLIKLAYLIIILILLSVPLAGFSQPKGEEIGKFTSDFFESESTRVVYFKKPKAENPDFDVVVLHVCSLSWKDLMDIEMENDPFLKQFNYLFTNFNTATTYSGPAVTRLLQANCGQARHENIYSHDVQKNCFMFNTLASAGFETYLSLNHDGVYGNFSEEIKKFGHFFTPPVATTNLPVQQYMFDNSNVYDDYSILARWWNVRKGSKAAAAALYHNTVSLHDGVHWADERYWWKRDRKAQYTERTKKLLGDINRFFNLLASSGRDVIVVFVPEHGMALSGSVLQAPGLRDIPLPQITLVPVGIKLIGEKFNNTKVKQIIITKPVSYLAVSFMLSSFVENNPFKYEGFASRRFIDSIPITDFVSENMGMQIVRMGNAYFLYGKNKKWVQLSEGQIK